MAWVPGKHGVLVWDKERFPEPLEEELIEHGWRPSRAVHANRGQSDVDPVAVLRACSGKLPKDGLTYAERRHVVAALHARGMGDGEIADHLDIGRSGVQRIRKRLGLRSNVEPIGGHRKRVSA